MRPRSAPARAAPRPAEKAPLPEGWNESGYLRALEWRFVQGGYDGRGPAIVWTRMRVPLIPDEEPDPLTRLLVVADSGNGASAELPLNQWLFINPELTVHVHRLPEGEWICMDAHTIISPGGTGRALSTSPTNAAPSPAARRACSCAGARRRRTVGRRQRLPMAGKIQNVQSAGLGGLPAGAPSEPPSAVRAAS